MKRNYQHIPLSPHSRQTSASLGGTWRSVVKETYGSGGARRPQKCFHKTTLVGRNSLPHSWAQTLTWSPNRNEKLGVRVKVDKGGTSQVVQWLLPFPSPGDLPDPLPKLLLFLFESLHFPLSMASVKALALWFLVPQRSPVPYYCQCCLITTWGSGMVSFPSAHRIPWISSSTPGGKKWVTGKLELSQLLYSALCYKVFKFHHWERGRGRDPKAMGTSLAEKMWSQPQLLLLFSYHGWCCG